MVILGTTMMAGTKKMLTPDYTMPTKVTTRHTITDNNAHSLDPKVIFPFRTPTDEPKINGMGTYTHKIGQSVNILSSRTHCLE